MFIVTEKETPNLFDHARFAATNENTATTDVHLLNLEALAARCAVEIQHFMRQGVANQDYGYELFRRALEQRNEAAWDAVWQLYGKMAAGWVRAHPAFHHSYEEIEYFVNRAFERLWVNVACKPGKFGRFPTLSTILRFLKMCVHSAVIDDGPNRPPQMITIVSLSETTESAEPFVHLDLSLLYRNAFWQTVDGYLRDDTERIVMLGYFYYGMKNRELYAQYPDLFHSVKQLSNLRLTILRRLSRAPRMAQMLTEFLDDSLPTDQSIIC